MEYTLVLFHTHTHTHTHTKSVIVNTHHVFRRNNSAGVRLQGLVIIIIVIIGVIKTDV